MTLLLCHPMTGDRRHESILVPPGTWPWSEQSGWSVLRECVSLVKCLDCGVEERLHSEGQVPHRASSPAISQATWYPFCRCQVGLDEGALSEALCLKPCSGSLPRGSLQRTIKRHLPRASLHQWFSECGFQTSSITSPTNLLDL